MLRELFFLLRMTATNIMLRYISPFFDEDKIARVTTHAFKYIHSVVDKELAEWEVTVHDDLFDFPLDHCLVAELDLIREYRLELDLTLSLIKRWEERGRDMTKLHLMMLICAFSCLTEERFKAESWMGTEGLNASATSCQDCLFC